MRWLQKSKKAQPTIQFEAVSMHDAIVIFNKNSKTTETMIPDIFLRFWRAACRGMELSITTMIGYLPKV
jgi:hypothetical protein